MFYNAPLDADSIDDPRSSHLGCDTLDIRAVAREHPQSEGGCNSTSLNVGNDIFGEVPRHRDRDSSDACVVAREHPQSEGSSHSTSLNTGNGVVVETTRYQDSDSPDICAVVDNSLGNEFELSKSAPDVGNDIISCLEYAKADKANDLAGSDGPPSSRI